MRFAIAGLDRMGLSLGRLTVEQGHDVAGWDIPTYVEDTAEVKWVIHWAMDHDMSTPVTDMSQQVLMACRDSDWPAADSVALLRDQYGGHAIRRISHQEPRR